MGIINATPDSFSDGGKYLEAARALEAAGEMIGSGADILDIGGESTRPGALPVNEEEQVRRIVPVIEEIRQKWDVTISVDTTRARVAEAALNAGANVINDVSAGHDDAEMFSLAARRGAAMVLMHRRGTPATMQTMTQYADVTREVRQFLVERVSAAQAAGVAERRLLIDPGIGFAKTKEQDLRLLHDLRELASIGRPVVVGTSRKKFIGAVTGETDAAKRTFGTAATVAWAVTNGVGVVRVHDVGPMAQVVRMTRALVEAK